MQYRRWRREGGIYFFTVVTQERQTLFSDPENVQLLRQAFARVKAKLPFRIPGFVILPDHLHCLWVLPVDDGDFSTRWRLIKSHFSRNYSKVNMIRTSSRHHKREKMIWQRRFWEHFIRDENDFIRHLEYIHLNPVKHGYVVDPAEWPYSSIHHYLRNDRE
jgi:putative transposase